MNKNINLVLIVGFILFCQVKVCAQQYQVQSFIEYYPKWAGGSELLKFSQSDCVLIARADFSSIIKCEIGGDTLTFDYPYADTTNVVFIIKYNDLYFHTQKMTFPKKYLRHDNNVLFFIWVDEDEADIEEESKSEWNHYFSVVFDRVSPPGDPPMAEPLFITDRIVYFNESKALYHKAMSVLKGINGSVP